LTMSVVTAALAEASDYGQCRVTKEHKGIGFVEIVKDDEAEKAMEELNGKEIIGKAIEVEKARPRKVNIWS